MSGGLQQSGFAPCHDRGAAWSEEELVERAKTDAVYVATAARLRQEASRALSENWRATQYNLKLKLSGGGP
jgi:hypothetical protein